MRKRSVTLRGHRTSVSLEREFWEALERIAGVRRTSLSALVAEIDARRVGQGSPRGLASALRLYVLAHLEKRPSGDSE